MPEFSDLATAVQHFLRNGSQNGQGRQDLKRRLRGQILSFFMLYTSFMSANVKMPIAHWTRHSANTGKVVLISVHLMYCLNLSVAHVHKSKEAFLD